MVAREVKFLLSLLAGIKYSEMDSWKESLVCAWHLSHENEVKMNLVCWDVGSVLKHACCEDLNIDHASLAGAAGGGNSVLHSG